MASPSSSRRSPPPPPCSPLFISIPEMDRGEGDTEGEEKKPLPAPKTKKSSDSRQLSVLCNKCRPSMSRDSRTSIVPLDRNYRSTPPSASDGTGKPTTNILHSLLRIKSPSPSSSSTSAPAGDPTDWKLAAHEISRKVLRANRRRDDALLEASRLRHTVTRLEQKVTQLEAYCLDLKKSLNDAVPTAAAANLQFPAAVAEARMAVRILTRSLSAQIRPTRVATLLKLPIPNTATLLIYIESILSKVFYRGFENLASVDPHVLDPKARCEMSWASYEKVKGLTWEEVLSRGTKYYSEGLSRFCDEKMGEIVGVLGWTQGWGEGLLQAFFGAAKGVWVVGLLGRCVYPAVTVMRAETGIGFDGRFMEDVVGGKVTGTVSVRLMVAPGFYLHDDNGGPRVVKCRVVCGL